jgi:hypothetical protein
VSSDSVSSLDANFNEDKMSRHVPHECGVKGEIPMAQNFESTGVDSTVDYPLKICRKFGSIYNPFRGKLADSMQRKSVDLRRLNSASIHRPNNSSRNLSARL